MEQENEQSTNKSNNNVSTYSIYKNDDTPQPICSNAFQSAVIIGGGDAPLAEQDQSSPVEMCAVHENPGNGVVAMVSAIGDPFSPMDPTNSWFVPVHNINDLSAGGCSTEASTKAERDFFALMAQETKYVPCYSRKVFVGGLPSDVHVDAIISAFRRFGILTVDWPHKRATKMVYPPKGYAFLIYKDETSVNKLMAACGQHLGNNYSSISSPMFNNKAVQIRPWRLVDAEYVADVNTQINKHLSIFVGGLPRTLRAYELAMVVGRMYGGVGSVNIHLDYKTGYPKGVGRVCFSNFDSYVSAVAERHLHIKYGDIDKRVQMMPYLFENQTCQVCKAQVAPHFCGSVSCLKYYCNVCWVSAHAEIGRELHQPQLRFKLDRSTVMAPTPAQAGAD